MPTADFFVDKALEYKKAFSEILPNYIPSNFGFDENPGRGKQQAEIEDLKFRTKLLFSEFDGGQLFVEKLKPLEDRLAALARKVYGKEDSDIGAYIKLLDFFIEHIITYRNVERHKKHDGGY